MRIRDKKSLSLIVTIVAIILSCVEINAQDVCFNYKGEWSSWYDCPGKISKYTDNSGLILRTSGGTEFFKFQINNFIPPTKKQLKEHRKSNQWFSYYGTVDYYVNDKYPTAEDFCKVNRFVIPNPRTDVTPSAKRHTACEIRIAPYKKHPELYLIIFDNVGIEVSIKGLKWD